MGALGEVMGEGWVGRGTGGGGVGDGRTCTWSCSLRSPGQEPRRGRVRSSHVTGCHLSAGVPGQSL